MGFVNQLRRKDDWPYYFQLSSMADRKVNNFFHSLPNKSIASILMQESHLSLLSVLPTKKLISGMYVQENQLVATETKTTDCAVGSVCICDSRKKKTM